MTEEARQLEPVRLFDDLGDVGATMKDFGPRLTRIESIEPDKEASDEVTLNAPGYDAEHRVWINDEAKQTYLDSLVHPLDADEEHPASEPPADPKELIPAFNLADAHTAGEVAAAEAAARNEQANELPKAAGTPAAN